MYHSYRPSTRVNFSFLKVLILFWASFSSTLHAANQQAVTWVKFNFPPIFITEGPFQNQGVSDQIVNYIQRKLPQLNHLSEQANISRIIKEMQQGRTICTSMLKSPEREKFVYYSIPASIHPTHNIYYLQDNHQLAAALEKLAESGAVSLERLLSEYPQFTLGLVEKRSYDNARDLIIERHKDQISYRTGNDDSRGILNMLQKRRIDYTIEFPWTIGFAQSSKQQIATLNSVEISEAAPNLFGYIACTKTPQGKQIIAAVNQLLLQHRNTPEYRTIAASWLDESVLPAFRRDYQTLIDATE